jgi:hypothetical protein
MDNYSFKNKLYPAILIFMLVLFILPSKSFAEVVKPNSLDELQSVIDSAKPGDSIDLVNLFSKQGFDDANNGTERSIHINKDITITSSDPKNVVGYGYNTMRAVAIDNINFDIDSGSTLTLNGYLYLRGTNDKAVFTGDGNLLLTDRVHIEGKNANPAINMPNGSVEIKNVMSYGGIEDLENNSVLSKKFESQILGGNSKNSNGASAIIAKSIDIIQDNLAPFDSNTSRGIFIRGGHGLGDDYQGGYALEGESIKVDLSGEKNQYATDAIVVGGSGGYGQAAIKGTNIDISCAGNQKIEPGSGVSLDVSDEKISQFYHGVIEVEDGGHLIFGDKDVTNPFKFNSLEGFDRNTPQSNGDKDAEEFLSNKNWSNFFGPSIWAKGNAQVDIKAGNFYGIGGNFSGPDNDRSFMSKLPIEPIIKMGTGSLNIGEQAQIKEISIGGAMYHYNSPRSIISSNGNVSVYGNKTKIKGPSFTVMSDKSGYINNPIAPKVGSSAIETSGEVLIDGANIIGGTLGNMNSTDENLRSQYKKGSGIVGASKVTLQNGAIVQGRGALEYTREGFKSSIDMLYNISAGHGLENVGQVIINNAEVHGGDIDTTPGYCLPDGSCTGSGVAGSGIKGAKSIEIIGSSLVTGGSSSNNGKMFSDRMPAGHGIDGFDSDNNIVTENVSISGSSQVYGGGSSTKAGHGIANVENITVTADASDSSSPIIFGGGCRFTSNIGSESAGSGLYNVGNAKIEAGKIESGNRLYQIYIDKYADKMHSQTKDEGYVGISSDISAIVARGKVIIDGEENFTPEVKSYYVGTTNSPIPSIRLDDNASLYIGKANVFSGGSETLNPDNILVKGGKYHVDIFKDNNINSYEEKENSSIVYKTEDSVALYRILEKTDDGEYIDVSNLTDSPAYDDIFLTDKNIHLYRENENLSAIVDKLSLVRKDKAQATSIVDILSKEKIKTVPSDNIVIAGISENPGTDDKENIDIRVEKIWTDSSRASYPVEIDLYAGGQKLEDYRLVLDEENNWQGSFYNLAPNRHYTVKEVGEENGKITFNNHDSYRVDISDLIDGTIRVTNTYIDDQGPSNVVPGKDKDKPLFPWLGIGNYGWEAEADENIQAHIAYIFGYPDSSIRPEGNITRAEAAALALRLAGLQVDDKTSKFEDCEENAWYNPYINKAFNDDMLIADGKKIMPNQNITRAEFAKLIYSLDEEKSEDLPFTDTKGHMFEKEIKRAYANGRIDGYPDNSFRPDAEITRAEAVKILNSLFKRVPDNDYIDNNQNELKQFNDLNKNDWFYYELVEAANSHEYVRKENGLDELWKRILQDLNK